MFFPRRDLVFYFFSQISLWVLNSMQEDIRATFHANQPSDSFN